MNLLISPYGNQLVNLIEPWPERSRNAATLSSIQIDERPPRVFAELAHLFRKASYVEPQRKTDELGAQFHE